MSIVDKLYASLPVGFQHAAVSAYGLYWNRLRFGPGYHRCLKAYERRQWMSAAEWAHWQQRKLCIFLDSAAEQVPYYNQTWTSSEKRAARAGQLQDIRLLDKDPLRADPKKFLREDIRPWFPLVFHTSGSSGTPIATYWTVQEVRESLALREARSARWAGVSFGIPRATFSGRMVEPNPLSQGPFHRYNLIERQAYLSPFHLRRETIRTYLDALRRHRIRWLTGYAVSWYLLAKFMLEADLTISTLDAVVTTSEKTSPAMRIVMERAFGCPVFEEYSTVENAVFASECPERRLHVSPDVGILEILRGDGTPCDPGEPGEVVATCFMRSYQPLVRFRLGDNALWDPEPCPCGRAMPVLKEILGRVEDIIIGPDGRQMVRFHGVFIDLPTVREAQVIQETLNDIKVVVVPTAGFGPPDVQRIIDRVRQRLGPNVQVAVHLTEFIRRTKSGKFQPVISLLQGQHQDVERTGIDYTSAAFPSKGVQL